MKEFYVAGFLIFTVYIYALLRRYFRSRVRDREILYLIVGIYMQMLGGFVLLMTESRPVEVFARFFMIGTLAVPIVVTLRVRKRYHGRDTEHIRSMGTLGIAVCAIAIIWNLWSLFGGP